jgi:GTP-binding protein
MPIVLIKREMRDKKSLTRRKASKSGCFDPSRYKYEPSPRVKDQLVQNRETQKNQIVHDPITILPEESQESKIPQRREGKAIVAICGRPNVGKSSLFNRLVGESKSLITPIAGTTRDRIYGMVEWEDREFILVDTGGMLGDTDEWSSDIHQQATVALGQADIILFVVNVKDELNKKERDLARLIRKINKPVVLVVNKIDNTKLEQNLDRFVRLGLGEPFPASAIHGLGEVSILENLVQKIAEMGFEKIGDEEARNKYNEEIRIAIVGKPNVGKSSFLNRVVGEDRCVVSNIPGTTTDPVDEHFTWKVDGKDTPITLIDTAGIKKKNLQEKDSLDHLSALWALKVITRAHVSLLLLDSKDGITAQDHRIGSFIVENLSSCIVVYNKWDIVLGAQKGIEQSDYTEATRLHLPELKYCPVMFSSAKTGFGVNGVINKAITVAQNRRKKIKTAKILRVLEVATLMKPPPAKRHKRMKIKFATQANTGAPTITLHVNDPDLRNDEYSKFLENRFRSEITTLEGSPLSIVYKQSSGTEKKNYTKPTTFKNSNAKYKKITNFKKPSPNKMKEKEKKKGSKKKESSAAKHSKKY